MDVVHPYKLSGIAKTNEETKDDLRVVNIFGSAPSGLVVPPNGETWGVNNSWAYGHKFDKLFVMDGWNLVLKDADNCKIDRDVFYDYLRKSKDMEIYSAYPEKLVAANDDKDVIAECKTFPKDVTSSLIPGTYFTSSIAHVLAFAAAQEELGYKKIDTINLYGIELWASFDEDEYSNQAPCVDFWLAYLYGKGIQTMIPAYLLYSSKSKNNLYGYFNR